MITSQVGKVIAIWCNGPKIRVRVSIPVAQLLCRLLMIEHDAEDMPFYLQYEKIPDFHYACGRINHVEVNCFDLVANIEPKEFGDWLQHQASLSRATKEPGCGEAAIGRTGASR